MTNLTLEDRVPDTMLTQTDAEIERLVLNIRELRRSAQTTQRVVSAPKRESLARKKTVEDAVKGISKDEAAALIAELIKSMEKST